MALATLILEAKVSAFSYLSSSIAISSLSSIDALTVGSSTPIITTSETKSSFLNLNQQNLKQFLNLTLYIPNKVKKEISTAKPSTKSTPKSKMKFLIMKSHTPQLVSQKKVASPATSVEI